MTTTATAARTSWSTTGAARPIVYLARSTATRPSASAYRPVELLPGASASGQYDGPDWNTNDVTVADFDGTGHPDLFVGNYFPDSAVLDPHGIDNVQMPSSLSDAQERRWRYMFRAGLGGTSGPNPTVTYTEVPDAIPYADSTGWTLGAATADLTGNGLPDLYIANDFGPGHLLYNDSTPGKHQVQRGGRRPRGRPRRSRSWSARARSRAWASTSAT